VYICRVLSVTKTINMGGGGGGGGGVMVGKFV